MTRTSLLLLSVSLATVGTLPRVLAHADGHGHDAWPALTALYAEALRAEVMTPDASPDVLREVAVSLQDQTRALLDEGVPFSAHNSLGIRLVLEDLEAHMSSLPDPVAGTEPELVQSLGGVLPVVMDVMAEAGIPPPDASRGPHDGLLADLYAQDGRQAGQVELKLHDDKGDLELWVTQPDGRTPFALPLDIVISVTFLGRDDRTVSLLVRDRDRNPDEDGTPTVLDGKTHYVIFPGDTGEDPTWLQGEGFQDRVRVTFTVDGTAYRSVVFPLQPHTHHGTGHAH